MINGTHKIEAIAPGSAYDFNYYNLTKGLFSTPNGSWIRVSSSPDIIIMTKLGRLFHPSIPLYH